MGNLQTCTSGSRCCAPALECNKVTPWGRCFSQLLCSLWLPNSNVGAWTARSSTWMTAWSQEMLPQSLQPWHMCSSVALTLACPWTLTSVKWSACGGPQQLTLRSTYPTSFSAPPLAQAKLPVTLIYLVPPLAAPRSWRTIQQVAWRRRPPSSMPLVSSRTHRLGSGFFGLVLDMHVSSTACVVCHLNSRASLSKTSTNECGHALRRSPPPSKEFNNIIYFVFFLFPPYQFFG